MASRGEQVPIKMRNASTMSGKSETPKTQAVKTTSKSKMIGKPFPKGGKGSSC